MSIVHRNSGFGLIEVVVATGIAGVLMLAIGSMSTYMFKSNATTRMRYGVDTAHEEIRALLGSSAPGSSAPTACSVSFVKALNPSLTSDTTLSTTTSTSFTQILDANSAARFVVGTNVYGDGTFTITSITLMAQSAAQAANNQATLEFVYAPTNQTFGSLRPRTIDIQVTQTGGILTGCVPMAKMSDGLWQRVTTTPTDVFYSGGKVGIGTSSPSNLLSVVTSNAGNTSPLIIAQNMDASGQTAAVAKNSSGGYVAIQSDGNTFATGGYGNTAGLNFGNLTKAYIITDEQTNTGGTAPFNIVTGGWQNNPTLTVTAGNPGNIGIGTTTPTELLDVMSPGETRTRVATDADNAQTYTAYVSHAIGGANSASMRVGTMPNNTGAGGFINVYTDRPLEFQTWNSTRMSIAKGSVGGGVTIGTPPAAWSGFTPPSGGLTVVGNVGIGVSSAVGALEVDGGTAAASTVGTDLKFKAQNGGSGNTNGGNLYFNGGLGSGTGTNGKFGFNLTDPALLKASFVMFSSQSNGQAFGSDRPNGGGLLIGSKDQGGDNPINGLTLAAGCLNNYSRLGWCATLIGQNVYYDPTTDTLKRSNASGGLNRSMAITMNADGSQTDGTTQNRHRMGFWTSDGSGDPQERFSIAGSGNVGIGNINPSYLLDVNGTTKTTNLIISSDRSLKRDIATLDPRESLRKICSVRPVSFNWIQSGEADQGVIAQELKEIFPELVVGDGEKTKYAVRYTALIAPLIASVQELNRKNVALEQRANKIELENKVLHDELGSLRRLVEELAARK